VRVQEVRTKPPRQFVDAPRGGAHFIQINPARQPRQHRRRRRGAMETPAVDLLLQCRWSKVLGRGEVERFPAQPPLLAQDGRGAEGVAAVQGQRVVEDV